MLKVLIVDDEMLIREELKELIEWKKEGMAIVGEAANGKIGLQLSGELNPDIVFLDIKMPVMDGLTFLEEMHKLCLKSRVIILSSHEDFSYAQKAIKEGADNYLLKHTLEKDTLLEAVRKAKHEIEKEKTAENRLKSLEERLANVLPIGKQAFFRDVLEGRINFNEKSLSREFENLGIKLGISSYHMIVFFVDDYFRMLRNSSITQQNATMLSIVNEIHNSLSPYGSGEVFAVSGSTYCLIMDRIACVSESRTERSLLEIAGMVSHNIKHSAGISISSVIAERLGDIRDLADCFKKAVEAVKDRMFCGYGRTFTLHERCLAIKELEENYLQKASDQIRNALESADPERIQNLLEALFIVDLRSSHNHDAVNYMAGELARLYNRILESRNMQNEKAIEPSEILMMDCIEAIRDFFKDRFLHLVKSAAAVEEYNNRVIKNAVNYIKRNYHREISLNMVASHVNVNRTYLSLLFKKDAGENFSDFVTRIRVEKAKELLKGNVKLYEVACSVGFSDPKYFSIVFKKTTGMSPLDYRKSIEK